VAHPGRFARRDPLSIAPTSSGGRKAAATANAEPSNTSETGSGTGTATVAEEYRMNSMLAAWATRPSAPVARGERAGGPGSLGRPEWLVAEMRKDLGLR
jgi:hypothetical protein